MHMSTASPTKEPTHAATTVDTATDDEPLSAAELDVAAGADEASWVEDVGVVVTVAVKPDARLGSEVGDTKGSVLEARMSPDAVTVPAAAVDASVPTA